MTSEASGDRRQKVEIDFYFDFISPYSYLAAMQLDAFASEHNACFRWIPVNLPKLIKLSDNKPPGTIRNKAIYSLRDLKRWAAYLDLPFRMIRPGSFDSRPALRIAAALEGEERALFSLAVFHALWSGEVDPLSSGWLDDLFRIKELPQEWRGLSLDVLNENTEQALKDGAFGVPTFFVHGKGRPEMFFGVDHMDFMARFCR